MKTSLFLPVLIVAAALGLAACGKKESAHAAHAHKAPHGGSLVEIGEHAYNLEFVHDPSLGKLSAYVLDGHAEEFVRIAAPAIQVEATIPGGAKHALTLVATANSATGEKVGDTSLFEAQAEWLKSVREFDAVLTNLTIQGTSILQLSFNFPKGNDKN